MRILFGCVLLTLLTRAWGVEWPAGLFKSTSAVVEIRVELMAKNDHSLSANVAWAGSSALQIGAGSFTAEFPLLSPTQAKLVTATAPEEFWQLRLSETGELSLQYHNELRPELNSLTNLAADTQAVMDFDDYSLAQAMAELPAAQHWPALVTEHLWPFWRDETAITFATARCNDRSRVDISRLCDELKSSWLQGSLTLDYTRMVSRQTFTYGAIFHLTGEPEALALMHQGVDILLSRVHPNGAVDTVLRDGKPMLEPQQATSQDLAYTQVGLAMAYYLTGDETLLAAIEKIKQYIFNQYRRDDWNLLAWTLSDQAVGDSQNQELVAQLDQLNAYLLLLYPHLPAEKKAQWADDIEWLTAAMLQKFHLPVQKRFAGQLIHGQPNKEGERHFDFGHSVKAYWMLYLAGQQLDKPDWVRLAEQGIAQISEQAFRFHRRADEFSQWAEHSDGSSASWWVFAELTQAAATLALTEPSFIRYLPESYRAWQGLYVDTDQGGVWMNAGGGAKQHFWKNGYHETELALVAYITTAMIQQQPFSLFFARETGLFKPYLFNAEVQRQLPIGLGRTRVIFAN